MWAVVDDETPPLTASCHASSACDAKHGSFGGDYGPYSSRVVRTVCGTIDPVTPNPDLAHRSTPDALRTNAEETWQFQSVRARQVSKFPYFQYLDTGSTPTNETVCVVLTLTSGCRVTDTAASMHRG